MATLIGLIPNSRSLPKSGITGIGKSEWRFALESIPPEIPDGGIQQGFCQRFNIAHALINDIVAKQILLLRQLQGFFFGLGRAGHLHFQHVSRGADDLRAMALLPEFANGGHFGRQGACIPSAQFQVAGNLPVFLRRYASQGGRVEKTARQDVAVAANFAVRFFASLMPLEYMRRSCYWFEDKLLMKRAQDGLLPSLDLFLF